MIMLENKLVPDTKADEPRLEKPDFAYVGENVRIKGEISVPDTIVLDGIIEGDLTASAVIIGTSGAITGHLIAAEADVYGSISEKAEIKQLLTVRSSGRISGEISYGELQLEKGAIITGAFSSTDFRTEKGTSKNDKSEQPTTGKGNGVSTLNLKKIPAESL